MNSRIEPRRVVEFVLYASTLSESVANAVCPVIGKFLFAEDRVIARSALVFLFFALEYEAQKHSIKRL